MGSGKRLGMGLAEKNRMGQHGQHGEWLEPGWIPKWWPDSNPNDPKDGRNVAGTCWIPNSLHKMQQPSAHGEDDQILVTLRVCFLDPD